MTDNTDVQVTTPLGSVKLAGNSVMVNTVATVATLILVCLIAFVLYQHTGDSKETNKAFIDVMKEQTVVMKEQTAVNREQNCLIALPPEQRPGQAEFCKRVTR